MTIEKCKKCCVSSLWGPEYDIQCDKCMYIELRILRAENKIMKETLTNAGLIIEKLEEVAKAARDDALREFE